MTKRTLICCLLFACFSPFARPEVRHIETSDGVDLYVEVEGTGTPCLYIHGGPGSGSYWLKKFFGAELEKQFQMIYLDQRGVSRSTSPKDKNYSMDRMVKDFEEVRGALGISQWLTLGHSFGGLLQMGYAERRPEAVKGMIMINCTLSFEKSSQEAIRKACEFLGIQGEQLCTDSSKPAMDRMMQLFGRLREKDLVWKLQYASRQNLEIMNATFDEVPNWNKDFEQVALTVKDYFADFSDASSSMQMPVLFFYGRSDWGIGPEHYKHAHFPNMLLWGSDVGHVPFLENKPDLSAAIQAYRKKYGF